MREGKDKDDLAIQCHIRLWWLYVETLSDVGLGYLYRLVTCWTWTQTFNHSVGLVSPFHSSCSSPVALRCGLANLETPLSAHTASWGVEPGSRVSSRYTVPSSLCVMVPSKSWIFCPWAEKTSVRSGGVLYGFSFSFAKSVKYFAVIQLDLNNILSLPPWQVMFLPVL